MTVERQPEVTVEFLGLAESRAGCRSRVFRCGSVSELRQHICRTLPQFAMPGDRSGQPPTLSSAWILNLNGDQFLGVSEQTLRQGDRVLLLSADAGG